MSHRPRKTTSSKRRIIFASAGIIFVAGLAWSFWPEKIQMSKDGYDLTIALYHVCNQQSDRRLVEIETRFREMSVRDLEGSTSLRELERIICMAKERRWNDAIRANRQLLQSQVRPSDVGYSDD